MTRSLYLNLIGPVEGRIEQYNIKRCFITVKDHKSDFQSNPTCRFINPSKSQMGKISRIINGVALKIVLNGLTT